MNLKVRVGTIISALLFLVASMIAGRSEETIVGVVPRHHNHAAKQTSARRDPKGWNEAFQNTLVTPPDRARGRGHRWDCASGQPCGAVRRECPFFRNNEWRML